jgi:hypothetical protein
MASWVEFSAATPELASAIRELVHQYGSGLGYLATVRPDGGPRVHPVAPVIMDDGLYCFLIDSPKRRDLDRDGRYALHAFPPEDNDDEAYLSGRARPVTDRRRIRRLAEAYRAEPRIDWRLYEFSVDVAMIARRPNGGGPAATVTQIWRDERVRQPSDGPAMRRGTPIG